MLRDRVRKANRPRPSCLPKLKQAEEKQKSNCASLSAFKDSRKIVPNAFACVLTGVAHVRWSAHPQPSHHFTSHDLALMGIFYELEYHCVTLKVCAYLRLFLSAASIVLPLIILFNAVYESLFPLSVVIQLHRQAEVFCHLSWYQTKKNCFQKFMVISPPASQPLYHNFLLPRSCTLVTPEALLSNPERRGCAIAVAVSNIHPTWLSRRLALRRCHLDLSRLQVLQRPLPQARPSSLTRLETFI